MYVYEYGHDCPAPNRRRVYISYLDSVKHFEPKCYRTVAYQAILVEYLRYVKERGFHTAHIWSCPPTPGDDYIFYSHPSNQLIPHEDMLRTWYHQMLATAKAQGVVIRTTTLYDEYFTSDGGNNAPARGDPTCLPYFEGDYIPGELENIIKLLKRDGNGSNDKSATSQDEVMRRLGHNLSKMKDNFIVVHLRSRRFAAAVERGEDVSEWLEDSDEELVRSKRAKISGKDFIPYSEEKPTQDSAIATDDRKPSHPALAPVGGTKMAPTSESQDAIESRAQVGGEGAVPDESNLQLEVAPTSESQDAAETTDQAMGEGVVSGESMKAEPTSDSQDTTETTDQVMGEGVVSGESMKTEPTSESQDATETTDQAMGEGVVSGESMKAEPTSDSQDTTETTDQVMGEGVVLGESMKTEPTSESQDATETTDQAMGEGVVSGESMKAEPTSESQDATETSAQAMGEGVVSGESKPTSESQDAAETTDQAMGEGVVSGESMKTEPTSESQDATETTDQAMGEGVVSGESMKAEPTSDSQDTTETTDQAMGEGVVSGESMKTEPRSESQDATETSAQVVGERVSAGESKSTSESQDATETTDQGMGEGVVSGESMKREPTSDSQDTTETTDQVMREGVVSGESMKTEPTPDSQDATATSAQVLQEGVVSGEAKSQVDDTSKAGPVSESAADEFKKEPQPEVVSEQDAAGSGTEATAEDVTATPDEIAATTVGVALTVVNESSASPSSQDTGASGVGSLASKQLSREEPSVAAEGETATGSPTSVSTGDNSKDVSTDKATESQDDHSKDLSADNATDSQEVHTKDVSTDNGTESREAVRTEQHLIDGSQDAAGSISKDISGLSGQVAIESQDKDSPSSGPGKRGIDEIGPALSRHAAEMKNRGPKFPVAGTVDEDEPMDSEMFESRQQFLNYCQTNHCQFDELRRTKHSTMMVLFQLHNPMAPLVLNQCGACYRDITHGVRYHCNDCSNFDLCQECYEPVTTGLWAQRDPRFAHAENHSFTPVDMEASEETEKTREERQLSLKSHLDLLEHVASCGGPPNCSLHNCQRMKKLFEHVSCCEIKPKKECKVCTRLFSLCSVHARTCGARESCPIPFCDRIRESNKRRRQQQQLMDDRRRRAQNELYHAGGSEQA
jgi:hypothetical protein